MMISRRFFLLLVLILISQLGVLVVHRRANVKQQHDVIALNHHHHATFEQRHARHKKRILHTAQRKRHARHRQNKNNSHKRLLVHLHIGKNGGTSMDTIGPSLVRHSNHSYIGDRHFDWSFIDKLPQHKVDVITMLRNPVSRAVSHFYFSQTLKWTRKRKLRHYSLDEYLHDKEELLATRTIWRDGQAGVLWLTGTHTGSFVGIDPSEIEERERRASNATAMCLLAADRLDQTLWFGILEDLDRSMELLGHALNLVETPSFPKANKKRQRQAKPTEWEQEALASLMPQDLWLYQYGKRLFEARYQAMLTGVFVPPERPPIPQPLSCTSTPTQLVCVDGPLKGTF